MFAKLSVSFPDPSSGAGATQVSVSETEVRPIVSQSQVDRVRMVGVTYRSASARPANKSNTFVFPPTQQDAPVERGPAPSFKDKESYQQLFKPLPKPESIPALVPFKVVCFDSGS